MKKKLTYIGRDDWSRPIYQDETERIWVDTDPRSNHAPGLCTITDAGEPCDPMRADIEVEFFIPAAMCGIKEDNMNLTRVSLPERIEAAQEGRTRQPEYLPCLVQQWAKTPIRAYFGPCKVQMERLLELLELSPEDENLAYQDIAMRVFDVLGSDETRGTAATELLAVPVWTAWEQTKKRRNTNDR